MIKNAKQKLDVSSLSEKQFIDLLREFQDFLKVKLEPCVNEKGIVVNGLFKVSHFRS